MIMDILLCNWYAKICACLHVGNWTVKGVESCWSEEPMACKNLSRRFYVFYGTFEFSSSIVMSFVFVLHES